MPDTRQILSLFEAVSHRDWAASRSAALKIAEGEEERGHVQAARKLRGALNGVGGNGLNGHSHSTQPSSANSGGEFMLSRALVRGPAGPVLDEVALRTPMRLTLNEVIEEWHASKALHDAGLPRRSRLLFHGPPGCGKTITALAIAKALDLPAYIVRFDALIGSYLGQTAARLREVFHFAAQNKCVLILDEIDVLGKRRGSQMDVGELDRIVVGLMQELDLSPPRGLIIGASNLAGHLDDALWRRFDIRLEFKAPTKVELAAFTRRLCLKRGVSLSAKMKIECGRLRDYAAAERLVIDEARRQVIRKLRHP